MRRLSRFVGLGTRILLSNFRRSPLPFKLTFILTYRCDCRCQMCNIWKRKVENEMTADEVAKFFAENRGFSWVNLSGGEIFTRRDLQDIAESVIRSNKDLYLLDFPTTGQQTEKIVSGVEQILAKDPPRLLVTCSLDGAGKKHDEVRRRKDAVRSYAPRRRRRTRTTTSKRGELLLLLLLSPRSSWTGTTGTQPLSQG